MSVGAIKTDRLLESVLHGHYAASQPGWLATVPNTWRFGFSGTTVTLYWWNGTTERAVISVDTSTGTVTVPGIVGLTDGDKGDVTVSASGATWTIDNNVVTNAKAADMATATFKGRTTSGTGDPEDLTATQATALLNPMVGDSGSGGTKGLAPAPAAGDAAAGKFLKADATFAVPVAVWG